PRALTSLLTLHDALPISSMPIVMDADRMARTLMRIAHEILERNRGVEELALVGIRTRGVPLARRLAQTIREINRHEVPTGTLDIDRKSTRLNSSHGSISY